MGGHFVPPPPPGYDEPKKPGLDRVKNIWGRNSASAQKLDVSTKQKKVCRFTIATTKLK